ncbi:peptidyl-prolyl cis-trans isomerase, cyclophilin-type [Teladorsagia circumcincta]|uniref:Peptidyl-prolyl cis-trans isomerase, cyclophilin-type n=1 Tax=Teladorsagia circumcincta TaxID=45464 RepID=A0A2G9UQA6_TELCI|nr:peptidyl-prolyl cis-trans isomerase, cyclophilin-type [Teladorsagia circumcincta]
MTKEELSRLAEHKYSAIDTSWLDELFMKYYWEWVVNFYPLWLAPNLITLIDGKQARRTGAASPLGELFDHGCDSISQVFVTLNAAYAMRLGEIRCATFFIIIISVSLFYCAHWSTYCTGQLRCNSRVIEERWIVKDMNAFVGETKFTAKIDRRPSEDVSNLCAVCKHFCGAATDAGIRCLSNGMLHGLDLDGFVLAPCCHHKSRYSEYSGRGFLAQWNMDSEGDFAALRHVATWAVCGFGKPKDSRDSQMDDRPIDQNDSAVEGNGAPDVEHELDAKLNSPASSASDVNPASWLDGKHVVFGQVTDGLSVVKKIESIGSRSGKPKEKVTIVDCGEEKAAEAEAA